MYLPGSSFQNIIKYGRKWTQKEIDEEFKLDNVFAVEYKEFLSNPTDIVMVACAEVYHDVINNVWRKINKKNKNLVFFSGNDNTLHYYMQFGGQYCHNAICADISSYAFAKHKELNAIYYFPWIDYDMLSYVEPSDMKIFRSYINKYQNLFGQDYRMAKELMSLFPEIEWDCVDGKSKSEALELMKNSMATLHIKSLEGYGYAIIESLARGRPVILYRPFSVNRSYRNWCIDGVSAIYFENETDFYERIKRFITDVEYRHELQKNASQVVRKVINNDETNAKLKIFFNNLRKPNFNTKALTGFFDNG